MLKLFDRIKADHTSGSGAILEMTSSELLLLGKKLERVPCKELSQNLHELLHHFPQFGLLIHFSRFMDSALGGDRDFINGEELVHTVEMYLEKYEKAQDVATKEFLTSIDLKAKNVLLHSNSSAIRNLFQVLSYAEDKPVIWQTFSSPLGEGRLQAQAFSLLGYEVNLFHEININKYISGIDMMIVGADLVFESQFLNKSGTYLLSLFANQHHIPVYVLAEERKIFKEKDLPAEQIDYIIHEGDERPVSDFGLDLGDGIRVRNHYFEYTPMTMVTQLIAGI